MATAISASLSMMQNQFASTHSGPSTSNLCKAWAPNLGFIRSCFKKASSNATLCSERNRPQARLFLLHWHRTRRRSCAPGSGTAASRPQTQRRVTTLPATRFLWSVGPRDYVVIRRILAAPDQPATLAPQARGVAPARLALFGSKELGG